MSQETRIEALVFLETDFLQLKYFFSLFLNLQLLSL